MTPVNIQLAYPMRHCNCAETKFINSRGMEVRIPWTDWPWARHDCHYVRFRSLLVNRAFVYANKIVPEAMLEAASPEVKGKWNSVFAAEMERLVAIEKLIPHGKSTDPAQAVSAGGA